MWHMPKLLNMHLWGKNANLQAIYETAAINVLPQSHCTLMTVITQDDDHELPVSNGATAQIQNKNYFPIYYETNKEREQKMSQRHH